MKRLIAVCLVLSLFISLVSCGESMVITTTQSETGEVQTTAENTGIHDATGFSVGFSRRSITPDFSVPLAGYGAATSRMSTYVLDDICVTCVAISDGQNKALLITQDLVRSDKALTDNVRKQIANATKVPMENILIAATHTHSSVSPNGNVDSILLWQKIYYREIVQASKDAIADLDAAEAEIGRIQTTELAYERRYFDSTGKLILTSQDGSDIVRHESEGDQELQLIRFKRKNQKDVILTNFQAHPTRTGGQTSTKISSDYIGAFRDYVEKEENALCAFFLGAAGDMNTTSRLAGEVNHTDYKEYARRLADFAKDALNDMTPVNTGKIISENRICEAWVNHSTDSLADIATQIYRLYDQGQSAQAYELCGQNGIADPLAASMIITRAAAETSQPMELCGVAFGDLSFVTEGYEMFSDMQKDIKAQTPFPMTFVLSCSQSALGYIPTLKAFESGGYEVNMCMYVPGTAEMFRDASLDLLQDLHNAS